MGLTAPAQPLYEVGRQPSSRRLRASLRANVVFSILCGLGLAVAGPFVAPAWGMAPTWLVVLIGLGLLPFVAFVARTATLPMPQLRRDAWIVIAADVGWVLASAAVLIAADPSATGGTAVATAAAGVALLAAWQTAGLLALQLGDPLINVEVTEIRRVLAAQPSAVWPLVTDHDLYGRLAPNLSSVEVISTTEEPLRRRCVNNAGKGWEETCTLWEEQYRYAVQVDTRDYPYPVSQVHGLWQVDAAGGGTSVTMRFVYTLQPTVRGGLFGVLARVAFRWGSGRILSGWQNVLVAYTAKPVQEASTARSDCETPRKL